MTLLDKSEILTEIGLSNIQRQIGQAHQPHLLYGMYPNVKVPSGQEGSAFPFLMEKMLSIAFIDLLVKSIFTMRDTGSEGRQNRSLKKTQEIKRIVKLW